MDKPQPFAAFTNQRTRLILTLACILLGGLLLAGIYLSVVAGKTAQHQTQQQGELLGQQTVTLIKPALLSDDAVSLNFVLNQLVRQPYIEAIILKDSKDRLIGRAGDIKQDNLIQQEILIRQQEQTLAILELHLNPEPNQEHINGLLVQTAILALIIIILALLGCWIWLNRYPETLTPVPASVAIADDSDLVLSTSLAEPARLNLKKPLPLPTTETTTTQNTDNQDDPGMLAELLRPAEDSP
ncbi:MAG: hypothetical protein KBT66_14485, partial [Amphritea sp.]|nr:hypothetical protein [Amphritea sp.]MBQ0785439.1 hypothetical protein [Amphritea sp.]